MDGAEEVWSSFRIRDAAEALLAWGGDAVMHHKHHLFNGRSKITNI